MSGQPVPDLPGPSTLHKYLVGKPTYGSHGLQWSEDLAFLLGRCAPPIASSSCVPKWSSGGSQVLRVPYAPSQGAQVLYIEVEPRNLDFSSGNVGAKLKVTVDLTVGALNGGEWIGTTQLDGTSQRFIAGRVQSQPVLCGWVDLTAVAKGIAASPFIKISIDNDSSDARGIRRVHVAEIPLASLDPVASVSEEVGIDPGSYASGAPIVAGDSGSARGFYRVLTQLEAARYKVRRHLSILSAEVTGGATTTSNPLYITSSTLVPITEAGIPGGATTGQQVDLYCRARRLYTTSTANKYKLVIRYHNTAPGAGGNPSLQIGVTPAGGSTTNTTVTLPDTSSGSTSGVWTDYLHSTNFDFPTSGTDQIVTVRLSGKVHMAGDTLTLASLGFIENES